MRAEREGEEHPFTLLLSPHQYQQEDAEEDGNLIKRTWLESKRLWQVAAPSIFSRIALFSVTVITQSFAGHLSGLDLAAISIVNTVIIAITFGFMVTPLNATNVKYQNPISHFCLFKYVLLCWVLSS